MDLNLFNSSIEFHIIEPQCLQCIKTIRYASMPPTHQNIPYFWTSMPPIHQNYSRHPTSKPVNKSASQPSNKQASKQVRGARRPRGGGTAAAAIAVSQELWNLGGALVQRSQEPNIPCGESLTLTKKLRRFLLSTRPTETDESSGFGSNGNKHA